jgi:hypothetical protein
MLPRFALYKCMMLVRECSDDLTRRYSAQKDATPAVVTAPASSAMQHATCNVKQPGRPCRY